MEVCVCVCRDACIVFKGYLKFKNVLCANKMHLNVFSL